MIAHETPATVAEGSPPGERRPHAGVAASVAEHLSALGPAQRGPMRALLWDDLVTEYDARFLSAHLRDCGIPFSPAFWRAERQWARDERRHFRGFLSIFERIWPDDLARLATRAPDFAPLAPLMEDEFAILCLSAYDELATVRAYRANLPRYDRLGPLFARFVRGVIADEAWHYSRFLSTILSEHPHRLAEGDAAVSRIRTAEGIPYSATFLLDHDDPVFTTRVCDEAARVLRRQLRRAARSRPRPPGAK